VDEFRLLVGDPHAVSCAERAGDERRGRAHYFAYEVGD
jgi:hypothetical protein